MTFWIFLRRAFDGGPSADKDKKGLVVSGQKQGGQEEATTTSVVDTIARNQSTRKIKSELRALVGAMESSGRVSLLCILAAGPTTDADELQVVV